jgi:hypothetical protein
MNQVAIIIPIYKPELTFNEELALRQCYKILNGYPIYFIAARNYSVPDTLINRSRKIIRFHDKYFKDIAGYNRLMLNPGFYKAFRKYKYILLYQLDCFVFRDELKSWCNKNYDYIGAPWVEMTENSDKNSWKVGNGGFSLRKVRSCYKMLSSYKILSKTSEIQNVPDESNRNGVAREFILNLLKRSGFHNNNFNVLNNFLKWENHNEDLFWSLLAPQIDPSFSIPDAGVAFKFSFETCPSKLFELNNHILPFGCHAWHKYEPDFWKQYIQF